MTRLLRRATALLALLATPAFAQGRMGREADGFDHWQHRKLFPVCQSCHLGAVEANRSIWPAAESCADCHDGVIEKRVRWSARQGPPRSNVKYDHLVHARKNREKTRADSVLACASCHAAEAAPWMKVERARQPNCFSCHGLRAEHYEVADTACTTCHLTLPKALALTEADLKGWKAPRSHEAADFMTAHGKVAVPPGDKAGVSASCATCHARDFCAECHVNAPEVKAIQALAPDPRSLAMKWELEAPATHEAVAFDMNHGADAKKNRQACQTCHTRQSCFACHQGSPDAAKAMFAAGPGRGRGATITRERPASHGADFTDLHAVPAAAKPQSCMGCHTRMECLDCHRPNAAAVNPGYHPPMFLSRHAVAAWSRETSCSDCHNASQFCQTCHQQSGLVTQNSLGSAYHDAAPAFSAGHGQAARQSLETCVSCHAERDCLTCHSALGGRRFNPHGPDFDAERLQKKNSQMCSACHRNQIPTVEERRR